MFFSLVPSSFLSSATARAITTFEIAVYYKNGPFAKKTVSALTCYTHAARRRWCGDGGISRHSRTYGHAREHVNGTCHRWFFESHLSTKAARLFPFYSGRLSSSLSGRSRATYIYLHTFLSMTESRPPPTTRELELLDPAWCVQQTNRRCRSG